jgi:hypothetical protein
MLVVAAVGGVMVLIGLLRWMEVGLILLIPISFLLPWGVGTGTQSQINLTIMWLIILLVVWLLRMLVNERRVILKKSRVNLPGMLFIVVTLLAFVAGNIQWLVFSTTRASMFSQIGGILMLILPIGLMLMVANVFMEEKWLRWMVWLFLGFGMVYLVALWVPGAGRFADLFNQKAVSAIFYIWCTALSGGLWLFNDELRGRKRWGLGCGFALIVITAFVSMRENASVWMPVLVVIAVLVWLKSWRLGLIMTLIAGILGVWQYDALYERVFRVEEYSAITRAATWPIMWELVKSSPIFGLGPSNYYFYTPLFSLMGYYVQFNSHNNYWDLAAQIGLVGLGVFIWLAGAIAWTGIKLRRVVRIGFQRGYVNGALAGLAGTLAAGLLADWFMPFVYNIGFDGFRGAIIAWLFLGGMLAIEHLLTTDATR